MKIAFVDEFELVVVDDDRVIPIGHLLADDSGSPQNRLERLITDFDALRPKLEAAAQGGGGKSLSEVRLRAPVPRPAQFLCAMVNDKEELGPNALAFDTSDADFFLKSPLTIVDPGDIVEHPAVDARVFHYEPELAIVIGRPGHDISASQARSHIFGYTIVIDASARGVGNAFYKQKPQRTFGPVGPWIVTTDEIPDPSTCRSGSRSTARSARTSTPTRWCTRSTAWSRSPRRRPASRPATSSQRATVTRASARSRMATSSRQ